MPATAKMHDFIFITYFCRNLAWLIVDSDHESANDL